MNTKKARELRKIVYAPLNNDESKADRKARKRSRRYILLNHTTRVADGERGKYQSIKKASKRDY